MTLQMFDEMLQRLSFRWSLLLYAATWTTLLTFTVAVASFSPELAFVSVITPGSSFSRSCRRDGSVRVPLDLPVEVLCFPGRMFQRSKMDMVVPPVFAAVIVACSACVVKAMALWEVEEDEH